MPLWSADPDRDKAIVASFKKWVDVDLSALKPTAAVELPPEQRAARIAELEKEVSAPVGSSRAEQLRLKTRQSELERLRSGATAVATPLKLPNPDAVVALVDTIPDGVEMKNGSIAARQDSTIEILGHFLVRTGREEEETRLLREVKLLTDVAGGHVVVLSFLHGAEEQGKCRGATGLILKAPDFDPKRVSRGRLPTEI